MSTRTPPPGPPAEPPREHPAPARSAYTVRSTEDLIALVPLVLGFHPTESLVMMTFGGATGSFHARVDLPQDPDALAEVARLLAGAAAANGAGTAVLVACSEDHAASVAALEAVAPALARAGTEVVDALRVDGRRWWSLCGADPGPREYDVSAHRFTAQHVLAGGVVRPDRQAVADSLRGDAAAARRLARAVAELHAQRRDPCIEAAWLRDWLAERAALPADDPLPVVDEHDAARVVALVQDEEQREVACLDLSREVARPLCETWAELVRRSPADLVAAPASVLALTAWLAGDGALAWCAVDRARTADPGCGLARAVATALQRAVPPASWEPPDARECALLGADEQVS